MKYRNGFVSNSSSSSFILANKTGDTKINIEVNLKDIADAIVTTKEGLDYYYLEEHEYNSLEALFENNGYIEKEYKACLDKINEGYTLFLGTVSNEDDDPLSYYFHTNGFGNPKGFEVIRDEN